jgi:hypothetical protein
MAALLAPGALLLVANYSTCPGEPASGSDACFAADGATPATQCRAYAESCSVSQRVASELSIESVPALGCHRYEWRWKCAFQRRTQCGTYWCDPISACLDTGVCTCPHPLRGDPVLQNCVCDTGAFYNGTDCVTVEECPTTTFTTTATAAATSSANSSAQDACAGWWTEAAPWAIMAGLVIAAAAAGARWGVDRGAPPAAEGRGGAQRNMAYVGPEISGPVYARIDSPTADFAEPPPPQQRYETLQRVKSVTHI